MRNADPCCKRQGDSLCLRIREKMMNKLKFQDQEGNITEFYIEEQTRIQGISYLLVSDSEEEEAQAYIMKDVSADTDQDAIYVMVEDEDELDAVFKVFEQMLEDVDFE